MADETTVYLVMVWNYADSYPDSIWTTREKAEARAAEVPYAEVEEYVLDSGPASDQGGTA